MNNLKKIRENKGISLRELARQIKVTPANISIQENTTLSRNLAERCSSVLGVSAIELLGDDEFVIMPKSKEEKEIILRRIK